MTHRPHIVLFTKGGPSWIGGRQYTLNLAHMLAGHRRGTGDYDLSVLMRAPDEIAHYQPLQSELRELAQTEQRLANWTLPNRVRWKLKRTFRDWTYPRLEEGLQRLGTTFAYPVSVAKVPSADWIPDFQYHHFPDGSSPWEIAERKVEFSGIVRKARAIVLSSAFAQADCHALYPRSLGRTSVLRFRSHIDPTWTAADPRAVVAKYHLPERFALISNALIPTKNHALVLDALAALPVSKRHAVHVVVTGDIYDLRNPGFYNSILSKIHTLGVRNSISVLGVIPKYDQIQLMRAAHVYLQPSLFEGWNTGVEEARLLAKAILLSDIAVHREQDPPNATFFDPRDADDLAARLVEVLDTPAPGGERIETERAAIAAYDRLRSQCAREFLALAGQAAA